MPQEELGEITELVDGEIGSEGCLLPFFSNNPDAYTNQILGKDCFKLLLKGLTDVGSLYHADIITTIPNTTNPFLSVMSD